MRVLLIEDELLASQRLSRMIQELEPEAQILETLESVEDAIEWWENHEVPELMFMDIHLADGSAFEILSQVSVSCPIIFTTAYDAYAIQAFKHNSIDYLLKPVKAEELKAALAKYHRNFEPKSTAAPPAIDYQELARIIQQQEQPYVRRLLIRFAQQLKAIEIADIAYFYIEERVCFLITHQGKRYPVDHTLDQLDSMLDPRQFFRVNRQLIANLDAIEQMHIMSKSRVQVELIPPAPVDALVSSERSALFKKWLKGELI